MAVLADRVGETSVSAGNGAAWNLAGAKQGYQSFGAGVGYGVTTYYAIVHRTSGQWEVGIGSVAAGAPDVLTRTTVLSGSAGAGVRVVFVAGTTDVFESLPSSKMAYVDPTTGFFTIGASAVIAGTIPGTLRVGDAVFSDGIANFYGNGNTQNIVAIKTSNDGTGGKVFIVESSLGAVVMSINSLGAIAAPTGAFATSGAIVMSVERTEVGAGAYLLFSGRRNGAAKWIMGLDASDNFTLYDGTGVNGNLTIVPSTGNVGVRGGLSATTGRFSVGAGAVCVGMVSSTNTAAVATFQNADTAGNNVFAEFYTEAGGGTFRGSIDYNRAGGLVRYNTSSDATLKNILDVADDEITAISLEKLRGIKLRMYTWKGDKTKKRQIGPIAQELFETFKGAVSVGGMVPQPDLVEHVEQEDGTFLEVCTPQPDRYQPWGVDKTAPVWHLVAGFQQHDARLDRLEKALNKLAA